MHDLQSYCIGCKNSLVCSIPVAWIVPLCIINILYCMLSSHVACSGFLPCMVSLFSWYDHISVHIVNRITPELRIYWVFAANSGVQTKFHGIALIYGQYTKHIGHTIVNGSAL